VTEFGSVSLPALHNMKPMKPTAPSANGIGERAHTEPSVRATASEVLGDPVPEVVRGSTTKDTERDLLAPPGILKGASFVLSRRCLEHPVSTVAR
jgi:hypothetical protein